MESEGLASKVVRQAAAVGVPLFKVAGVLLLIYIAGTALYAFSQYSSMKAKLLTYGLSEATGTLLAYVVMLIALALPAIALARFFFGTPRPMDWAAAIALPLISWSTSLLPANFDATTGEALKYCARRPSGELFCLDRPGVDPLTQRRLVKMDAAVAERTFRSDKGLAPKKILADPGAIQFFDSLSDPTHPEPKVWVVPDGKGCYLLFDNPGVDPISGDALQPVTKSIVRIIMKCHVATPSTSSTPSTQPKTTTTPMPSTVQGGPAGSHAVRGEEMASWDGWSPGMPLPIGVRSRPIAIPVGCSIRFMPGHGELFAVRYQFYTKDWHLHPGGNASPSMSHAAIEVLSKGRDLERVAYSLNCTKR